MRISDWSSDVCSSDLWLRKAHSDDEAALIGRQLVQHINDWWRVYLQSEYGLGSALELQYETHFRRFLMPTIRGAEEGSKKRYAGLITRPDGSRSEEPTSELQSLMRISYAVFCLK